MGQKKSQSQIVIDSFDYQYNKEFDFYSAASQLAAQLIETQLINRGIRAIVSFRAKNPSRLHDKLLKRMAEEDKTYDTIGDIYEDIVDLSGVRVALYFNSELDEIDQIIHELFEVKKKKEFPIAEDSIGYKAIHYRGCLKENVLTEQQKRYSQANVEVQIASLLMHAWAEVEHDIIYKPLQGKVSKEEKEALNELNRIVLDGERALEKLQKAICKRKSFSNHYDLYAFLSQYIFETYQVEEDQIVFGNVKKLYNLLIQNKIDTYQKLKNRLKSLKLIIEESWTISDQIIEHLTICYPKIKDPYLKKMQKQPHSSLQEAIGAFVMAWTNLERILKSHDMGTSYRDTHIRLKKLVDYQIITEEEYDRLHELRNVRNKIVHGIETPPIDYLKWYTEQIQSLGDQLNSRWGKNDISAQDG